MNNSGGFRPDWASAPGDTIADILEERDLSMVDLAQRIGQTPEEVADLIDGRASITLEVARGLARVLGASVEFWMSRDFQYREDLANFHEEEKNWLDDLPLADMIKFGWLTPAPHPSEELSACLRFFAVPSIRAWREKYAEIQDLAAFRTSPTFDSRPAALAAWLRQGEVEAEMISCRPWNPVRFKEVLSQVRHLTRRKDPESFIPALQEHCARCGVAAVVVRAPTGCRASGVTRFISTAKAVLQLSFRYLTDDHFWFTFYHEAGHLLLHGKDRLFLEGAEATPTTAEEREANEFAGDILIPAELRQELQRLPANGRAVIRFARRVGVSPGIVVGQMQHLQMIGYNWLNSLKRRFTWEE